MSSNNKFHSEAKYIDPLTDFGFKYLFGRVESKPYLIHFLNSILEKIDLKINDLTFKNTVHIPKSSKHRGAVFDLYCQTSEEQEIIIEVQREKQKYIIDRALYYASHLIVNQPNKGNWDYKMTPVIIICIIDFPLKTHFKDAVNYISYSNRFSNHKNTFDKLNMVFLQIPKIKTNHLETNSCLDFWLYIFRNLNKLKDEPKNLNNYFYKSFFDFAEIAKLSEDQMKLYNRELSLKRDEFSRKKALIEESKTNAREEIIIRLFTKGYASEKIQDLTGLDLSFIKKTIKEKA